MSLASRAFLFSEPTEANSMKAHQPHAKPTTSPLAARRRHIDPTTCERDYSNDELEFMQAVERYKRTSGRMFPTCSELLEVLRGLGYAKAT